MHILGEWKIRDIEQKADQAVRRLYELDSLRSDVDRLECSLRESSSENDGLRNELQAEKERIDSLERNVERLLERMPYEATS